jgi:hypothetical protein
MGGSSSVAEKIATSCMYEKEDFNEKLDIIRDANKVCQFYASLLLSDKPMPNALSKYVNFSGKSEEYFVIHRKEVKDLVGSSYYDFYQKLGQLQNTYESPFTNQSDRRTLIADMFNKCYNVQQSLIEDLWHSCDNYGMAPPAVEAQESSTEDHTDAKTDKVSQEPSEKSETPAKA